MQVCRKCGKEVQGAGQIVCNGCGAKAGAMTRAGLKKAQRMQAQTKKKGNKTGKTWQVVLAGVALWAVLLSGLFILGNTVWKFGSSLIQTDHAAKQEQDQAVKAESKPDAPSEKQAAVESASAKEKEAMEESAVLSSDSPVEPDSQSQEQKMQLLTVLSDTKDTEAAESPGTEAMHRTDFLIPHSSERPLQESDITGLSSKELRIARNEIFARHGYVFQSRDLQEYFSSKPWYKPNSGFTGELTSVEVQNVDILKSKEGLASSVE